MVPEGERAYHGASNTHAGIRALCNNIVLIRSAEPGVPHTAPTATASLCPRRAHSPSHSLMTPSGPLPPLSPPRFPYPTRPGPQTVANKG